MIGLWRPSSWGLCTLRRVLLFSAVPVFLSPPAVHAADARDRARGLEASGDRSGARSLYLDWINENPGHEEAQIVLFHAAMLSDTANEAAELLSHAVGRAAFADSAEVWERLAALESSLGRLEQSMNHFDRAARLTADKSRGDDLTLKSLILQYSMGNYQAARSGALTLSRQADGERTGQEAAALAASALAAGGRSDASRAVDELLALTREAADVRSPRVWAALIDAALRADDAKSLAYARTNLAGDFPHSVAGYLADGRVLPWINPWNLQTQSADLLRGWQAGAFSKREGAAAFRLRLESAGFVAWLEYSDDGLWRVFVDNDDGNADGQLKAAGF